MTSAAISSASASAEPASLAPRRARARDDRAERGAPLVGLSAQWIASTSGSPVLSRKYIRAAYGFASM